MSDEYTGPKVSAIAAGFKGRCPRCGKGSLFDGFIKVADECKVCRFDLRFADSADGPVVFITMIVGFIVVGAALVVEFSYQPPIWLHMVLWIPLLTILALGMLRPAKGLLIAAQYHHRAEEGRLVDDPPEAGR